MGRKKVITPPSVDSTDTRVVLSELADAYGAAVTTEQYRSDVKYDYKAWVDELHQCYPITDYNPVLDVIDEYPTPPALTASTDFTRSEVFSGGFLRIAAADMISTAFLERDLRSVPEALFTWLYDTPDVQTEPIAGAVTLGALGVEHPSIEYVDDVLLSDALDDFAALFCHLRLVWAINPEIGLNSYEQILTKGHPLFMDEAPPDQADTWEAATAQSFAASILASKNQPLGFRNHCFTRNDEILEQVGYPEGDEVFNELAAKTVEHVDLSNIHYDFPADAIRRHTDL